MPITRLDGCHFMWAGAFLVGFVDGRFYFYRGSLRWSHGYETITALELDAAGWA
jgi:hypothetical protein